MKYVIGGIILVAIQLSVMTVLAASIVTELQYKIEESKCISNYISKGVERIDIKTSKGSCLVIPNGYYL